ncbi:MAG: GatB/YqeY domain-containing protein [Alphaproteobacteria bacterium]|nr:GatB/YqeY domain-containing protein [Alphaproteobacteria bacterium]
MIRSELTEALKVSLKAQDKCAVSTIRLILAALKDRDIRARADGNADGVSDDDVLTLLQTMVKQRGESIRLYEEGGRLELAEREREEVEVIRRFMPKPLEEDEMDGAVQEAIREIGARDIKDMGKTMALLKQRYSGRMDFSKASGMVRQALVS